MTAPNNLLPLTGAQLNVWYHQQVDPNSLAYNIGQVMRLKGSISIPLFTRAQNKIWKAAQSLRSKFVVIDGEPFQEIFDYEAPPFEQFDLRSFEHIEHVLADKIQEHQLRSHDLSQGKCCSFALFQVSDIEWVWSMAVHHLAIDAPGGAYLTTLLAQAYKQLSKDATSEHTTASHDWAQAIDADLSYRSGERYQKDRDYWLQAMAGFEKAPSFSQQQINTLDLVVPKNAFHTLSRAQYAKFSAWSIANSQSLNAGFLTAFCIYLARLTGEKDLCIGSPTSGRKKNTRGLMGMLSNATSLRVKIQPTDRVVDVLLNIARTSKQNLRHNSFPIGELTTERRKNHLSSPFSMVVNLLVFEQLLDFGTASGVIETKSTGSVADLQLNIFDRNDGDAIELRLDYNPAKYTSTEIQTHLARISRLIEQLPDVETATVTTLQILNDDEKEAALQQAQGPIAFRPSDQPVSLIDAFIQRAQEQPKATALHDIVDGCTQTITYQELHQRSNQVARLLIKQGVGVDQIIAVLLERSVEQIVSMLAILKAGAAYLPIDPEYPDARQAFMLEDSKACAVISTTKLLNKLQTQLTAAMPSSIFLDDLTTKQAIQQQSDCDLSATERIGSPQYSNLAYLIYTSGSTGKPKAAGNTNEAILNRLEWMQHTLRLTPQDRILQKTGLGFDVAVWEWYLPLMTGSSLVLSSPQGHKDPHYLKQMIEQFKITVLHFVPTMLSTFLKFLSSQECSSLQQIVTSGEALSAELQNETFNQFSQVKLWNLYGPTEAAIDVSVWACQPNHATAPPPIGHPIWNTQLYILDETLELLPAGASGELYIAGIGLARGYLGRSGLTAERFVACPFGTPGARMYRTGDLVRRRTDGAIEYLGRLDNQLKIRGYRIELGEIESALLAQDLNLAQVAVIARKTLGDQRLVAYLVARSGSAAMPASDLRSGLSTTLPDYMVPAAFVYLDALPLTPNGKLDVRALPEPEITGTSTYRAPVTEHEQLIATLFAELTGAVQVGLNDSFFALGGHSLLAMRLIAQVKSHTDLEIALGTLFERPTVAELASTLHDLQLEAQTQLARGEVRLSRNPIVRGQGVLNANTTGDQRALSFGQIRLWTLTQIEGTSAAYNMPATLRLSGVVRAEALEHALRDLVGRHEPLRTNILNNEGHPLGVVQALGPETKLLIQDDLSTHPPSTRAETLAQIVKNEAATPFDLSCDLMIRARLVKLEDDEHVLILVMHHIACDGVSTAVFYRELTEAYQARLGLEAPHWPPLAVSYADHAAWQRAWLEGSGEQAAQSRVWQAMLADAPELLSLPTDYPRDAHRSRAARYLPIEIDAQTTLQLQDVANRHQTTLFTVLVALYGLLLGRLANQNDVVVGAPVAGRIRPEVDEHIGFYVNTLALRVETAGHPNLKTLIERVKENINHALSHQELPFDRLVEDLGASRSLSHTPVFQAMLAWQTQDHVELKLDDLEIDLTPLELERAKFDLTLSLAPSPDGAIRGTVEYDASLFTEHRVAQWISWLTRTLNQAQSFSLSQTPVDTLSLLSEAERTQVVELFNQTQVATVHNSARALTATSEATTPAATEATLAATTLPELFEQQVARTPEATALVFGETSLTYAALEARANQLARHLIRQGLCPEQIVAVALPRSIEMIVAMLAVLKSGAAYLPLDPDYPAARLSFMLTDSQASLLITQTGVIQDALDALQASANTLAVLDLSEVSVQVMLEQLDFAPIHQASPLAPLNPYNLAYLIYTSGSTGRPKGAGNTQIALINHMLWMQRVLQLNVNDKILQKTGIGFDVAVGEWFLPLMTGATLVMTKSDGHKDPAYLRDMIQHHNITIVHFVASMLGMFLEEIKLGECRSLRLIVTSGEALNGSIQAKTFEQLPGIELWDLYGPTEAAIHVTYWQCRASDGTQPPPIGRPIDNMQMYILDAALNPLPKGIIGELYIAGTGLARGYLGRPALTAERFLANPFAQAGKTSARMYRSGDLARWTEDGVIEYLGRADSQIKIRGFRIELGEIESALASIAGVAQCTVQAQGADDAKHLVAYMITQAEQTIPEASTLRAILAGTLPDYMVPAAFVVLDAFPLTPNGKLDTRALPAPEITGQSDYRAPLTAHEQLVAELFTELTGATRVGLDDNFFTLGGHSLLAMRLVAQIRHRTGASLALRTLFECPTPELLAPHLHSIVTSRDQDLIAGLGRIDQDIVALSYGQSRLWALDQVDGASATYNMAVAIHLTGQLDVNALRQALIALTDRHEALRTVIQESDEGAPFGRLLAAPSIEAALETYDLSVDFENSAATAQLTLQSLVETLAGRPFVLQTDLPLRATLIHTQPEHCVLVLTLHHHAGDGVSVNIFAKELEHAYGAYRSGHSPNWPAISVQYSDWAAWQQRNLEANIEAKLTRARQRLAELPELLTLPLDHPRSAQRAHRAGYLPIEIPAQTVLRLEQMAAKQETTLFTVVLAIFGATLAKIAGQDAVVIGAPVAGRNHSSTENMIGFLLNTLALPVSLTNNESALDLVQQCRQTVQSALDDQDLPFERLIDSLALTRSFLHTPVFQAMLAFQNQAVPEFAFQELDCASQILASHTAKFDLTLHLNKEIHGILLGNVEFDNDLFNVSSVNRWIEIFLFTIEGFLGDPEQPVRTLALMTPEAERVVVVASSGATKDIPAEYRVFTQAFEAQAKRHPDAIALRAAEAVMTYAELDEESNRLARYLIAQGVKTDQIVGLLIDRSPTLIIGILAIVKAGAAYLPLDANYPSSRLAYMLKDSQAIALLCTEDKYETVFSEIPTDSLPAAWLIDSEQTAAYIANQSTARLTEQDLRDSITGDNLCYVMYTSGSTGTPKGVSFTHRALGNLVKWKQDCLPSKISRVLQYSPIGFDASAQEIASALSAGSSLVLIDEQARRDPRALLNHMQLHQVQHLYTPFVVMASMAETNVSFDCAGWPEAIFTAGEQLQITPDIRSAFLNHPTSRLHNFYGPTEAHVVSNYSLPDDPNDWEIFPPIGTPIWNTQLYILDSALNVMPDGIVGELYIAGICLARGYLNRPGLTAERFVACPFSEPSARMYRTGDLAIKREGQIHYMGRVDQQIKLRGFRIELPEIETTLLKHFACFSSVAVLALDVNNIKSLVAYCVLHADEALPDEALIRSTLAKDLPEYMIPSYFIVLGKLPLTPHGKLDRRALPLPEGRTNQKPYRAPSTEHERLVCQLFADITGQESVGVDDHFFSIGGHSLLAMRLIARLRSQHGLIIPLRTLFEFDTPESLAPHLETSDDDDEPSLIRGSGRITEA